jgi:integrase
MNAMPPEQKEKPKRTKRLHKAENRLVPKRVVINGIEYWRVRIGVTITRNPSNPPIQEYFRSKTEADTFTRQQLVLIQNQGAAAFSLSDEERVESTKAIKKLKELGATLQEAVDYFIEHAKPAGGTVTFSVGVNGSVGENGEELVSGFLASRRDSNCKARYVDNLVSQTKILSEQFGERKVNEIKKAELEKWLARRIQSGEWTSHKTRNNYIITLRAIWAYFKESKWCAENVATKITKSSLDDVPTALFTPDEAKKLLTTASRCFDGQMLPAIAIGLFAGLRRSEICALDWSEVKEGTIEVTAAKAKTRRRRSVYIQPNLAKWLTPWRKKSGPVFSGELLAESKKKNTSKAKFVEGAATIAPVKAKSILQVREERFDERRKHLADEAELNWVRNILRHSAASYHLAHFGDENSTALQMGHSPDVLFDHYREIVTKEQAAEYWAIVPELKKD